jgi:NAD+ kinase
MKSRFERIALLGKTHQPPTTAVAANTREVMLQLIDCLHDKGADVVIETETAEHSGLSDHTTLPIESIGQQCDLALIVGGDGTMLSHGRRLAPHGIPLIGINQGRLGFMTDIPLQRMVETLHPMLEGHFDEERRSMIHAEVWRDGLRVFQALALNDVVLNRGGTSGMVEFRITVDDHFVANQRADGLIIATPTGSTAYSLSAGGPVLQPSLAGWVMAPIAPHTLSNRPLVLSDDTTIGVELVGGRDASANFDMQSLASLLIGDSIVVRKSPHQARLLHPKGLTFFDTLRKKLHWNEGGV